MSLTIDAVYEKGCLRLAGPVPLKEQQKVSVTIHSARSVAGETAGMVPWTGDVETLDHLIRDPEFGILESP